MKLLTIDDGHGGTIGARLRGGDIVHLRSAAMPGTAETWLPSTMRGLLDAGDEGLAVVRRIVERVEESDESQRKSLLARRVLSGPATPLLAPLPEPRFVLAAGLAYRTHLAEMEGTPPPPHPTAFMKTPDSIVGPDATIGVPAGAPDRVDYEGELAVVFGRRCHRVSSIEAMECVAGFTLANDVSARDWVADVWKARAPWEARLTWEVNLMGKQFPGFTSLGPLLLTRDEVADVKQLRLVTRLNGTVMQSALVDDMIFELPDVIAWFSRWYRFMPGDVLLTGTPAGVGAGRRPPVFMHPGDTIEVECEAIGVLRNLIGP